MILVPQTVTKKKNIKWTQEINDNKYDSKTTTLANSKNRRAPTDKRRRTFIL